MSAFALLFYNTLVQQQNVNKINNAISSMDEADIYKKISSCVYLSVCLQQPFSVRPALAIKVPREVPREGRDYILRAA